MIDEPIDLALSIAGVVLTFGNFEIYALPGFNTSVLYKGEASLYEVEKQNFVFQVSIADVTLNDIKKDTSFEMTDGYYIYNFILDRDPIFDLTGWAKLNCNYTSKVLV